MICTHVRQNLAALVYGDLPPGEIAALEEHLKTCAACRRERAALIDVRRRLDELPAPQVTVDLPNLYYQAAIHQQRRLRRWRRAALAAGAAAAAAILFVFLPHLQISLEAHQGVARWGTPPAPPSAPSRLILQAPARVQDELQLLSELVEDQAGQLEALRRQRQQDFLQWQARFDAFQRQTTAHWLTTERDVAALCAQDLTPSSKGTSR